MKITALAVCSTLLFCTLAVADDSKTPAPAKVSQTASENYIVTLSMLDKDQKTTELALVVSSTDFKSDFTDAQFDMSSFVGTLTPEDGDTIFVKYALSSQIAVPIPQSGFQYKTVATQSTVRLELGVPVQILKSPLCTYTLSISRLSDQQAKGK